MMTEMMKYKELLYFLVHRELRIRYRNSLFGFMWSLLEPLGLMIIYTIVFSVILRFEIENYSLFVLSGLIPWMFLSSSLLKGTKSLTRNASLIKKVHVPRQIFPITIVIANLINFIPALVLVIGYALILQVNLSLTSFLLLPLIIVLHGLFVLSIVLVISVTNVFYRDVEFILNVVVRAWMYLSPVIYPLYMVPEKYMGYYLLNPMALIVTMYRSVFVGEEMISLPYFLYAVCFIGLLVFIAWKIFNRLNRRVGEVI